MTHPPTIPASPSVLVPCGLGCRHAEPLRGNYADWIWCHRAAATDRIKRMDNDCHWFEAAEATPQHSSH